MSERIPPLQLNPQRHSKDSTPLTPNSTSSLLHNNPETHRSERFIPFEFRDKHIPRKTEASTHPHSSLFNTSLHKLPETSKSEHLIKMPSQQCKVQADHVKLASQSMLEHSRIRPKINEKKHSLKQIYYQGPKLRETHSTQCHTPKGLSPAHPKLTQFKKLKLLGKGKFGDVYLVRHDKTGFIAALKVISKGELLGGSLEDTQKAVNQITRQIKIQAFLNHPNLIKLYDFFSDQHNIYLVLELACDGHLYDFLAKSGKFSEETCSILIREVVEGVEFLHKQSIIHRDIKLQNIVLAHGMAKICDFGWSVYCPKEFRTTICGTPLYLSPEVLTGKHYNRKVDIWAIGSLGHELVTGEDPFKIKTKDDLVRVVEQDFEMSTGSSELRSFLTFILRKNPAKRPDTDTIKRHPFIEKYKDFETSEELCKLIYQCK